MQIGRGFFAAAERGGDDSDNVSAGGDGGAGDHPHQAERTASIDEAEVFVRQRYAELDRAADELRIVALARSAKHAY